MGKRIVETGWETTIDKERMGNKDSWDRMGNKDSGDRMGNKVRRKQDGTQG